MFLGLNTKRRRDILLNALHLWLDAARNSGQVDAEDIAAAQSMVREITAAEHLQPEATTTTNNGACL